MARVVRRNVRRRLWQERFCAWGVTGVMVCFGCRLTIAQLANQSLTNDATLVQQAGITQQSARGTIEQSPAHKYFTDVVLVNQDGKKMRFYSDLIQHKVVIINSFFGTCQTSCCL
jgi:protein SCO1